MSPCIVCEPASRRCSSAVCSAPARVKLVNVGKCRVNPGQTPMESAPKALSAHLSSPLPTAPMLCALHAALLGFSAMPLHVGRVAPARVALHPQMGVMDVVNSVKVSGPRVRFPLNQSAPPHARAPNPPRQSTPGALYRPRERLSHGPSFQSRHTSLG